MGPKLRVASGEAN